MLSISLFCRVIVLENVLNSRQHKSTIEEQIDVTFRAAFVAPSNRLAAGVQTKDQLGALKERRGI